MGIWPKLIRLEVWTLELKVAINIVILGFKGAKQWVFKKKNSKYIFCLSTLFSFSIDNICEQVILLKYIMSKSKNIYENFFQIAKERRLQKKIK